MSFKFRGFAGYAIVIVAFVSIAVCTIELFQAWSAGDSVTVIPEPSRSAPFPRVLRDAKGFSLKIPAQPKRIVSQTLATDEILLTICPTERIVALSSLAEDPNYSNVVERARQIPGRTTQGPEQILKFNPDLILVASYSRAETIELLQASKAPVFRFANFDSFEDIKSNIRTVGYATGYDAEAQKLVKQMEKRLNDISALIPKNKIPLRVMSYDQTGYTGGSGTTFNDMVTIAGAVNVSAEKGIKGFAKISSEKIAEWRPDYIVVGANRNDFQMNRKLMMADPMIRVITKGDPERIILIDNRHYLTVSQFVVDGAEDLAYELYSN
ncbi:ABC transporter substrate-binding protein [bacterium]|nr:ABC transporter substrate-binding protein [bacterium]MCI0602267.1 ABC transporter substrate-binding protein [bacterium]